jgi:hypothetical protein
MNVKNVQRYLARQAARLRHTARQMLRVAPPWSRVAIEVYPHSPWKSATEMAILRAAAESVAAARRLQASPDAYACRVELRNAGARQQRLARGYVRFVSACLKYNPEAAQTLPSRL